MNQVELEKIVEISIGERNVALLSEREAWKEFSPFDRRILDLYARAIECMKYGNFDPKKLIELNEIFDLAAHDFVNKLTFGKDQNGIRVTSEQLFGEIRAVRPEYLPYLAAKFIMLWAAERKTRLIREEELNMQTKYEAVRIAGV